MDVSVTRLYEYVDNFYFHCWSDTENKISLSSMTEMQAESLKYLARHIKHWTGIGFSFSELTYFWIYCNLQGIVVTTVCRLMRLETRKVRNGKRMSFCWCSVLPDGKHSTRGTPLISSHCWYRTEWQHLTKSKYWICFVDTQNDNTNMYYTKHNKMAEEEKEDEHDVKYLPKRQKVCALKNINILFTFIWTMKWNDGINDGTRTARNSIYTI